MRYEIEKLLRARFESPLEFNKDDIILASFPKSGNTWLRFLVANINFLNFETKLHKEINFQNIAYYSPEIRGNRSLKGKIQPEKFPVFLKTHFPATQHFDVYPKVVLFREPKKTINSYFHYLNNEKGNKFTTNKFLKHWRYGYQAWNKFHLNWLSSNNCIYIQYDDLLENTQIKITELYKCLGYDLSTNTANEAVALSSRENMSIALNKYGDPKAKNKSYNFVTTTKKRETAFSEEQFSLIDEMCQDTFGKLKKIKYKFQNTSL